ncbi:putative ribosome biogenesis GTPase RsgA [Phycisphaerae bacterium RAS1]|nr:putative ribosome biogenesis GTPase RsgA [Phycisphaerae bacterium RAS1]
MAKKSGRKVRVDFRKNRQARARGENLTRRFRVGDDAAMDASSHESMGAKGELSRRRTIIVDDQNAPLIDESLWKRGTITEVHGAVCSVDDGGGVWMCTIRRVLRTMLIEERGPVTVGDGVWFADLSGCHDGQHVGVIERVEPRRSLLSRRVRAGHDTARLGIAGGRQHVIAANADQLVIVASVAQPRLKPHLIDRYVVAALRGGLRPIICFNKADLLSGFEEELRRERDRNVVPAITDELLDEEGESTYLDHVIEIVAEFQSLGYQCLVTSATTGTGVEMLREALRGHISALSGQSGVGKSSLANAVEPGLGLVVGDVSDGNEKGKHTTTRARLLRLETGGFIVDTPGVRGFDLWDVDPGQLEAFFEEFVPYVPRCRFNDCLHRDEDGCAVRAAVDEGNISPRRYVSYLKMFEEV